MTRIIRMIVELLLITTAIAVYLILSEVFVSNYSTWTSSLIPTGKPLRVLE